MPIKTEGHVLSVSERSAIEEQNKELEAVLDNKDELKTSLQDPSSMRRKLNNNKSILASDLQGRAKGKQKDAIRSEIRRIEETINKLRPTRAMMEARPGTREFTEAVRVNVRFHRECGPLLAKLKDLKRRLEPDDPDSGNLELTRPE